MARGVRADLWWAGRSVVAQIYAERRAPDRHIAEQVRVGRGDQFRGPRIGGLGGSCRAFMTDLVGEVADPFVAGVEIGAPLLLAGKRCCNGGQPGEGARCGVVRQAPIEDCGAVVCGVEGACGSDVEKQVERVGAVEGGARGDRARLGKRARG